MGAQIAAHLTNAGITTILFDLPSDKGDQNAIVEDSIKALKKLKPQPLGTNGLEKEIIAANYNTDLDKLSECNFIIEAISERLDWKQKLYHKIMPFINENAILATNTSGLFIHQLANDLPLDLKKRFCGVHFFNPPRYMKLVELIPHELTDPILLRNLETFLVARLGKGVVHAKDTPNFIGNRIGVFAFLTAVYHSQDLGLAPDIVDALTGTLIGRSKSATFRTMDVVGLDTMLHVVNTLKKELPNDPWVSYFTIPNWVQRLIDRGALGQKTQVGIYKKVNKEIQVYDYHHESYRPIHTRIDPEIMTILRQPSIKTQFEELSRSKHPQAQFLWRISRDLFHYCAYHLANIAHTVRDVDSAMRWGYGWKRGPFELWQMGDWEGIAKLISKEKDQELLMKNVSLPNWVFEIGQGPYQNGKAFSPQANLYEPRSDLAVYRRQYFPDQFITDVCDDGETIFETSVIRLWTLHDKIPILSFKTKKNAINMQVLDDIQEAIARAEKDYDALILWQRDSQDFSVGADLKQITELLKNHRMDLIEAEVEAFQKTSLALRYAKIPTVAAISGFTLGGGCELSMHATKIVASFETYMGLVEVGVGLLPAGGGCKELALRASRQATDGNLFNTLKIYFEQITTAMISSSAMDAVKLNYMQKSDQIVFNNNELLYLAKKQARALADLTYHPPLKPKFPVAGRSGIANFMTMLVNLREGDFITDHEFLMANKIAHVLCGGEIENGSMVDEDWILHLEREAIMALIHTSETVERIKHMLEKGKPLRN